MEAILNSKPTGGIFTVIKGHANIIVIIVGIAVYVALGFVVVAFNDSNSERENNLSPAVINTARWLGLQCPPTRNMFHHNTCSAIPPRPSADCSIWFQCPRAAYGRRPMTFSVWERRL